jgi:hypothetical protein
MKRFIVLSISFLILISNSLIAQKIDTKILIGHTYKIKNYKSRYEKTFINVELAEHDFPNDMNWYDADAACRNLGPGWRLPTSIEMNTIRHYRENEVLENLFENKKKLYMIIKTFPNYYDYWCDTVGSANSGIRFNVSEFAYWTNMGTGFWSQWSEKTRILKVRAVRSL